MTALYTVMATGGIKGIIPIALVCVIAVLLIIALCIGVKKGVRRVSWTGLCWLSSGIAFFFIYKKLGQKVVDLLSSKFAGKLSEQTAELVCSLLLAFACVLVVLCISGIFAMIFRPKIKWVKKNSDEYTLDEDGVEYEEDFVDYDDYEEYESKKEPVKKGYGTPSVFGRILGGIFCMLNIAMILGVALGVVLLIANATALKDGALSGLFAFKIGKFNATIWLLGYSKKYALDMLFIGVLVAYACKGNKNGFVATLRNIIVKFGVTVAVFVSFYLPFSKFAGQDGLYYLHKLVTRFDSAFGKMIKGQYAEIITPIVSKIFAGLLLAGLATLACLLVSWLLKKASDGIKKVGWLKTIDGSVSGILYLVFGVLVCACVWALLYILGYFGVFYLQELAVQESLLSKGLLNTCENVIKPFLAKFTGR